MMLNTYIYVNRCRCGWLFPALSPHVTKCPQCRVDDRLCAQCGTPITGHHHKKFCSACAADRKRVLAKYNKRARREAEKYKFSDRNNDDRICDYDCANCKYSDCILPVDEDDYMPDQGNLFEK